MLFAAPLDFPGIFLDLLTLSDSTFYHLLGFLAVISFLRLFLPLHRMMSRELFRRNEIVDLAEKGMCTEYDVFIQAYLSYYGFLHPEVIKQDFIKYLKSWPDNYILPLYLRIFLDELDSFSEDSRHDHPDDPIKNAAAKLPGNSTL